MIVPPAVLARYGWDAADAVAVSGGLINATFAIRLGEPIAIVQRLHPVFGAAVNLDIEAVTTHLAARGLTTPRLVRTLDDRAWVDYDGEVWRALTWVDGVTAHAMASPAWAETGGALVGRFHRAVADFEYSYRFARAGVHDTAAHLTRLHDLVTASAFDERSEAPRDNARRGIDLEAATLGADVLAAAARLPELPATALRHCHGDLKISNVMFVDVQRTPRAHALVDLDTVGLGTIAFELGDAMRSWCNPCGEDVESVRFDLAVFAAAIHGFRSAADPIVTRDELRSIVDGLETVCIELAARFAVDVFRDDYFGWDRSRFPSRRAHNVVRARGQLALGLAVRTVRNDALDIVLSGT